ncbi:DEAD/DEAH box helicase [Pseudomonas nitroreducens]|uniref:DEAD/DEAH box helicase n=1 Tax=Pseudomonas nitroreducens TaxID=46680 RepID=A0ABS0KKE7_PSENT|nr:DEAD/DEAH box helicase [Pseudomonas nitroreducens]MBG6288399.1 DEAD/DEAH box helicase [Pseudomonas nitroreducens]
MLANIIEGAGLESIVKKALYEIHRNGPVDAKIFEQLAYIKRFHSGFFEKYEGRFLSAMGLFYKTKEPASVFEEVYEIYAEAISDAVGKRFTPMQASAYNGVMDNKFFSFSAPTSAGKSFLFRELIEKTKGDIVIVVPSRALIAEYYEEVIGLVGKDVLVLQFIDDVNREKARRRVFIVTPERGGEIFKYKDVFNVELFLLDEAQISEEPVRGLTFDSFVRRADRFFPKSKKVFAHPFIENPEAQLDKHDFKADGAAANYNLFTVGKMFLYAAEAEFKFFSPNVECEDVDANEDLPLAVLQQGGTLLIYMSKAKIYSGDYLEEFDRYVSSCTVLENERAVSLIEELRVFIGAGGRDSEKYSMLIDLMKRGIVIHHGSIPLRARLLIEKFIKSGFARICFSTSTLSQGVNMPFDVVWIDNFRDMRPLVLKNLIGRAGRTTARKGVLDYGYTIVNKRNLKTFRNRFSELVTINSDSSLDKPLDEVDEDLKDLVEAVKNESYDDELHLTESQVERIKDADVDDDIKLILDSLYVDGALITAEEYYQLGAKRDKLKKALKNVYVQHLRRKILTRGEVSILSAAIPILLWHVQGKSFSEIVSLRFAFLTELTARRKLVRRLRNGELTKEGYEAELDLIFIRYSPIPTSIPDRFAKTAGLYPKETPVRFADYDLVVYDTYDYLDKVVGLSLVDPLCAAFSIYFEKTQDARAVSFKNYIKFGTNDELDIWLLRYGFSFEDIEWLRGYVVSADQDRLRFKEEIGSISAGNYALVERFI